MKCILFFCFIISVSFAFECPSSKWFRFRNKCYFIDRYKSYSFQENVNFCESLNATTVSIHSEEENNFIKSKLIFGYYWLGIRQVDFNAKTYAWLDRSFYNYSNWFVRYGENVCAGASILKGGWYDRNSCSDTFRAFCQIDFDSVFYKMQPQINQLRQDLKDDRKADERRFNETNGRLDKASNTTNDWIKNLDSAFEAKLNKTDIQVDNMKEELARLHLVNTRLAEALNTQNDLIANMSSDLRKKGIRINSTEHELVRLSLYITRLENSIHTQNDLIERMRLAFKPTSTQN